MALHSEVIEEIEEVALFEAETIILEASQHANRDASDDDPSHRSSTTHSQRSSLSSIGSLSQRRLSLNSPHSHAVSEEGAGVHINFAHTPDHRGVAPSRALSSRCDHDTSPNVSGNSLKHTCSHTHTHGYYGHWGHSADCINVAGVCFGSRNIAHSATSREVAIFAFSSYKMGPTRSSRSPFPPCYEAYNPCGRPKLSNTAAAC